MTRTREIKNAPTTSQDYSVHYPNKREISELELNKRFEKLKKLLSALKSAQN